MYWRIPLIVLTTSALVAGCAAAHKAQTIPGPTTPSGAESGCDASLWTHVYHPQRLHIIDPCRTVTGTVIARKIEADGDAHISLKLDPEFASMVNDRNISVQHGGLVLEPVCVGKVSQEDAKPNCLGYQSPLQIPPVGAHVRVTGAYVLDVESNHGWNELHPVTSITPV